jgi:hypothetical protein
VAEADKLEAVKEKEAATVLNEELFSEVSDLKTRHARLTSQVIRNFFTLKYLRTRSWDLRTPLYLMIRAKQCFARF